MVMYKNYDEALLPLQNWVQTQPHLPKIEQHYLRSFISACEGDVEKAKKLVDIQYTMRNSYSHIFIDRDPFDDGSQIIMEAFDILTLSGLDPQGNKIHLSRVGNPDPDKFLHTESVKLFLMINDAYLSTPDPTGTPTGHAIIFDLTGFTLKHLSRINLQTLRIFMRFIQEAISLKLVSSHLINCPSYIDKIMAVLKPFMNAELLKIIHLHQINSETLYEFIPKDMLPVEYGGKGGTIKELKMRQVKLLTDNKEYLMNKNYWKVDESKRPANQQRPDAMEGNFRSLDFD